MFLCMLMPGMLLRLTSTELALTNQRLLGKVGAYHRKTMKLDFKDIQTVRARRSMLGMLFNYGSITISGGDIDRIVFRGIARPFDLAIQCNEAIEFAILGRNLPKDSEDTSIPAKPVPVMESSSGPIKHIPPAPKTLPKAPGVAKISASPAPTLAKEKSYQPASVYKDPDSW
jgi:hypothetical protein